MSFLGRRSFAVNRELRIGAALVALTALAVVGCTRPRSELVGTGAVGSGGNAVGGTTGAGTGGGTGAGTGGATGAGTGGATGAGTGGGSPPPHDGGGSDSGAALDAMAGADTNVSDGSRDGGDATTDTGPAPNPAALTLAPASGSSTMFGTANIGEAVMKTFTVANMGEQPSSAVTITLNTSPASGFSMAPAAAGGCVSGTTTLSPGGTCAIQVRFSPTTAGTAAATLAVSATAGGSPAPLALAGSGAGMATLVASTGMISLGAVEVGKPQAASVIFTNNGNAATGLPTVSISNSEELAVASNGCTAALAPAATCTLSLKLTPSDTGYRNAIFTLSASPGGSASVTITASGASRLTIVKAGDGSGTVTSTPGGIDCGATCSVLIVPVTEVTLNARTQNGSGSFLSDVSGLGCSAPSRDCKFKFTGPMTVTYTFSTMTHNLVFGSSMEYPANLGSAAAYDAKCNSLATAAGINTTAGNGYVALTSDAASTAVSRLGSARGWVRMDGQPFGDTLAAMFAYPAAVVFNSVHFNENGGGVANLVLTGTRGDGTASGPASNCNNFTSTSATTETTQAQGGASEGGPSAWVDQWGGPCSGTYAIHCLGKTKSTAVGPMVTAGRKIWMSNSIYTIGAGSTPDQTCQAQRPSGVTTAQALIATSSRAAASVLSASMTYVRVDGTLVGTGANIIANNLNSGVWQSGDGMYRQLLYNRVWTGTDSVSAVGSATCGDWTATSGQGFTGLSTDASYNWWAFADYPCNATGTEGAFLYCVQTAP